MFGGGGDGVFKRKMLWGACKGGSVSRGIGRWEMLRRIALKSVPGVNNGVLISEHSREF